MCQRKTKQMREFEPILKANGYREIRSNGSHFIYSNGNNQITVNQLIEKLEELRDCENAGDCPIYLCNDNGYT